MSDARATPGPQAPAEAEDQYARDCSTDPERSILLQAPAGSGKTTVLTERYLRLLAQVDEPEEILAITFTRKAAAEMRARVLRALDSGGAGEAADARPRSGLAARARAHAAARDWQLDQNPGRLRIQTIDALNHWIASQLPVTGRAGGLLRISDRAQELYRIAARRTLADAEAVAALQPRIDLLFERLDNDYGRLERLLADMLGKRAHWLPRLLRDSAVALPERVTASLRSIVARRIDELARRLPRSVVVEGAELAMATARHRRAAGDAGSGLWRAWLEGDAALAPEPGQLRRWQGLAALALTSGGEWRRAFTVREGFPPQDRALKERGKRWVEDLAGVNGARAALAAIVLLPEPRLSADETASLEALAAVLTFACQELEVVFQDHGQVDHSYIAAAARQALTEEGAPSDLALRLGARLRHLLVDEFQDTSIEQLELLEALTAGWTPGDGNSVLAVGDPMQSIYLFREAEVGLFLRARERGLGEFPLEKLRLMRNFRSAPGLVDWVNAHLGHVFPPADDVRTSAVQYLASVAANVAVGAEQVELHCTPAGSPAGEARVIAALAKRLRAASAAESIAILVSSRTHAAAITAALDAAGLPVAGVDLVALAEVPVVRDLTALTRALDHLGDRSAWLAILRAPWCGLTLEELHALVDGDRNSTMWELLQSPGRLMHLASDSRVRLERTREALANALEARDRAPLAAWVEATWLALGGPAACARDEDLVHADAYFRALGRRTAAGDWRGGAELGELLGELYANSPGAPRDAVQIMTIHGAKGLEFDHVLLPGLGRRLRQDREPLMRWIELPRESAGSDLLIAPLPPPGSHNRHPLGEFIRGLQRERLRNEQTRLLYVAATRARRGLYLFGHLRSPGRGENNGRPETGTLLELLWPAVAKAFPQAPPPGPAAPRERRRAPHLERLPSGWRAPDLGAPLAPAALHVAGYDPDALGVTEGHTQGSGLKLTGLHEGELVSVHIDRTFIDASGVRWIVDVCNAVPGAGQSADAFIADEAARRHAWALRSAALVRLLGPEPVRAACYFTALDRLWELSERP